MVLIGRELEFAQLEKSFSDSAAQLAVLLGRRGVGKSHLLRMFAQNKASLFLRFPDVSSAHALATFARALYPDAQAEDVPSFKDWNEAFEALIAWAQQNPDKRKLFILEEMDRLVQSQSQFLPAFLRAWDRALKDLNVMIVFTATLICFVKNDILNESQLKSRVTAVIEMMPLDFYCAMKFFPVWKSADLVCVYSILGGMPNYLKSFDPGRTITQNIKEVILDTNGRLHSLLEERIRLYFSDPPSINAVLSQLAHGPLTRDTLLARTKIRAAALESAISELIAYGVLEYRQALDPEATPNAQIKAANVYRVTDPFTRFWFRDVQPILGDLECGHVDDLWTTDILPSLPKHAEMTYTEVCQDYLNRFMTPCPVERAKPFGYLRGKTLVPIVRLGDDGVATLALPVWRESPADLGDVHALLREEKRFKALRMATQCDVPSSTAIEPDPECIPPTIADSKLYIFSRSGFTEKAQQFAKTIENLQLIDLATLTRPKLTNACAECTVAGAS